MGSEVEVGNMSEIKGICPKCGAQYFGWVLTNPFKQKSGRYGSTLEISRQGVHIRTDYSSFTSKKYRIASNHIVPPS
jgi:hypothetical protein